MTRPFTNTGLTRRTLMRGAAAGAAAYAASPLLRAPAFAQNGDLATIHETAAAAAKKLAEGRAVTLKILQPSGSLGNVKPVADRFAEATGIKFEYLEVPLGEISQKVLLEAVSKSGSFDLALPASFSIPDLAESGILVNLDQFAQKYEPADFQKDALYTIGDYYKGSLYGYQTDGDTYLMFYNKPWLNDENEKKGFADKNGYELKVPDTWPELDAMMAWIPSAVDTPPRAVEIRQYSCIIYGWLIGKNQFSQSHPVSKSADAGIGTNFFLSTHQSARA
jgi:multiple sugar transport system substrate-binding protein